MNNAVVIVTYNRLELLKECLACVCRQTIPFSRVIVVDNHSTDGTRDYLEGREDTYVFHVTDKKPDEEVIKKTLVVQADFMMACDGRVRKAMTGC